MNEVCLYPWDPYSCEWSAEYLWRYMDWIVRLDIMLLGFLLFYVIVIAALGCYRYLRIRYQLRLFLRDRRRLGLSPSYLALGIKNLQSIITSAPFLGLIGACFGILGGFGGGGMQKDAFFRMVTLRIATSLVPTAAGLVVVTLATWAYNHLCLSRERAELQVWVAACDLERRSERPGSLSGKDQWPEIAGNWRRGRRPRVNYRHAVLPNFGLMAVPLLVCGMFGFMIFPSKRPMGLGVRLGSGLPVKGFHVSRVAVKIAPDSKVIVQLDSRKIGVDELEGGLESKLKGQIGSTVCVDADPQVAWSTVAGVIDAAHGAVDYVLLPQACP